MRVAGKQYGHGASGLDSSPAFQDICAGKRSIELDLHNEADRSLAMDLAGVADVVIENMRPGKMESLGLGYDDLSALNPQIIVCSQSATGRNSSTAIPGYAPIFWAEGGGASLMGWPTGTPGAMRGPVDFHAAAFACLGVLALLAQRDQTGKGGYVDCSAIEAVVSSGIDEIMLVTGGTHAGEFLRLLGNGREYGIHQLSYGYQEKAGGIAEALGLAEHAFFLERGTIRFDGPTAELMTRDDLLRPVFLGTTGGA